MLNDEEFGSDTDDEDYVPDGEGHDASEEENSGDEEETGGDGVKKDKKKKVSKLVAQRNALFKEGGEGIKEDWKKEILEEKKEAEDKKEKERLDSLWSDFKSGSKPTAKPKPSGSGSGLASLFGSTTDKITKKPPDEKPKNLLSSLFDVKPNQKEVDKEQVTSKPKSLLSSLFEEKSESKNTENKCLEGKEETDSTKIEITKIFDFAGEEIKVTKHVEADSTEAQKYLKKKEEEETKAACPSKRPGGLASVVGSIAKKPKMGCLDKSKMDWNEFVEDHGIKEELQTFNKGKDGFVEKQMFLERADLRRFEVEKALREKTRKPLQR